MISAVLLNWKRPANVQRIVAGWKEGSLVTDPLVWNNNPDQPLALPCAVVQANQNMTFYPRFAMACLAKHECVLIQDDDLELPANSLRRLYAAWREAPEILHGVFGRKPKPDGSYAVNLLGDREVPVVLTRVLLMHRRYAAEFFRFLPAFEAIQAASRPPGNGEDILLSYIVRRASGRLHRIHDLRVQELPAPHAVCGRAGHYQHRTRLLRACEAWLTQEECSCSA